LGSDVSGKRYTVGDKNTSINDSPWGERGFVARIYTGGRYFEYSFNTIGENEVKQITENIVRLATASAAHSAEALQYPSPDEEAITRTFQNEIGIPPNTVSPSEIINKLTKINRKGHAISELLVDFIAGVSHNQVSKIFISDKKDLEQSYIWSEAYMFSIIRREDVTREAYKAYSGFKGLEILDEMESGIEKLVDESRLLLDAKPVPPGEYDIVCSPDAVGIIVHEAFGHGVELDMFLKNRANAQHYMGREVAASMVKMRDGAASAVQVSSYLFDDEGTLAGDTTVIENGILTAGISDALTAMKLGLKPTGNGKRENFEHKAYSRMTNTFFEPGTDTLEDMIASVKKGYLIMEAESGMEDPKDWGIQVVFTSAREIADGKLTDNRVAPVIMTGYVPDVLKAITMVSKDFELTGSGGCGKGHKEWVKVSCGGPYIKTRARLG
jgi:TldD protein